MDYKMRTEFIQTESRKVAVSAMTWAAKIVKVSGGYKGFESMQGYKTWKNQS